MFAVLPRSAAPAQARAIHELLQIQTEWMQERMAGQDGQSAVLQGTGRSHTHDFKFTSFAVFAPAAEVETVHRHIRAALFRITYNVKMNWNMGSVWLLRAGRCFRTCCMLPRIAIAPSRAPASHLQQDEAVPSRMRYPISVNFY
jgi:hypothetical protein